MSVGLLQFTDDTVLVGGDSWHNFWSIKAFLRCFELSSRMWVNRNKSKLIGYNLECDFFSRRRLVSYLVVLGLILSCFLVYLLEST